VRAIRAARAASDMAWISAKESGVVISNSNMENTIAATVKMVNLDNYKYNKNGVQHVISLDDISTILEGLQSIISVEIDNDSLHLGSDMVNYSENRAIPIPPDLNNVRPLLQKDIIFSTSDLLDFISNTIPMWDDNKRSRIIEMISNSGEFSIKYDKNGTNLIKKIKLDKTNPDASTRFDAALLLKMSKAFPNKSKISMRWYEDVVGEFVVNLDEKCSAIIDIGQVMFVED
jgi:hypothetical protein